MAQRAEDLQRPRLIDSDRESWQKTARATFPQLLTSLVGREHEIATVSTYFKRSGVRLITLTGPGGIGKTRLALGIADRLQNYFPAGAWFVSLASISDPDLVVPTVARKMHIAEQANRPVLDTLIDQLHDRRTLLVLDNFEHVITAATEISTLLVACPALCILVTSREALRLSGEHEYLVPPLAVSDGPHTSATSGARGDAVRLFVERAKQVTPDFALTDENVPVIIEICRRLDGVPLALELAAARLKVFSPADLLARLDQPLKVLTGGPRDVPARQRTLRATLAWSYDLLSPNEQQLFRRLSVFAGGCTLAAVEAIADGGDTLETLASLVDKSLARRVDRPDQDSRYEMLEPVRQFARESLLSDCDEASEVRQQHAEYFYSTCQGARKRLNGPEGPELFSRLESERDNLRAALSWLHETHQVELGLNMVGELVLFWLQHDYIFEGRRHVEAFLSLPEARRQNVKRATVLSVGSWLWIHQDEIDTALLMADEAYTIASELGDRRTLAHALFMRGVCRVRRGDVEGVQVGWMRAIPLARECGDAPTVARLLANLAGLALRHGDLDQARAAAEESLAIARAKDLKMVMGPAMGALGASLEQSGEDRRAADLYLERLSISRELGMPVGIAASLERLARLLHRRGDAEHAVCLFAVAVDVREPSRSDWTDPIERSIIDEDLNALRATLPEATFRIAWDRGLAMTVEEAAVLVQRLFEEQEHRSPEWPDGLTPVRLRYWD